MSYVLLVRFLFSLSDQKIKQPMFALVNIGFFIWLSLLIGRGLIDHEPTILKLGTWDNDAPIFTLGSEAIIRHIGLIGFYVLIVAVGFYLMRAFSKRQGILPWLAFFYPIAILIIIKYLHSFWNPLLDRFEWKDWVITATIIGLSYMAFRLSYLVLEVRNGTAQMPTLSEYLGFAFFLPTLVVGPINPFSTHQNSIQEISKTTIPVGRCLMRIIVGATKYLFLANLANQLSYSGIFLDGKPHAMIDLVVAVIFYYL
ncbi:MAG: hypothetical protein HC846_09925, partial [Blastocatellia bacterium]|nr:hypothetical protein [Blastocatellia bacterium]